MLSGTNGTLRLKCLIEGESIVFSVKAACEDEVSDLKEFIKSKRELDSLKDVDPHTLELWRVYVNLESHDKHSLGNIRLESLEDNEELKPWKTVLQYWPHQPPNDCLHIIVKVPRTPTISPSTSQNSNTSHGSSDDDGVLASLHELHTHLWGEDRIDHRDELACSILDLGLFNALNPIIRPDKILLIRNEYVTAYDYILERTLMMPKQPRATLVTGQPGIGKSLFLFYVLARRLHDHRPVAFQINKHKYCLFDWKGVTLHSTYATYGRVPEGTWALSDTDVGAPDGPCAAFRNSVFHPIHVSSPSSKHWKRWVKILGASKYIMDVWGPEEFQTFLALKALNIPQGIHLFERYGLSPRYIIDILTSNINEDDHKKDVNTAAHELAAEFSTAFPKLIDLDFGHRISCKIITVRPKTRRGSYTLEITTPFLSCTFGLAMSHQAAAQQHTFFRMLSSYPSFCSAAGWLFEHYAHNRLSEPKRKKLGAYTPDGKLHHIPVPSRIIAGSTALKRIQPPHNFYWRPVEPNFKGVDAIIRFEDDVWALQYTISGVHKPVTDGLLEIRDRMNHKTDVKWHLVMVGSELRNAKEARDNQKLGEEWKWTTTIYASELPLGQFDEKHAKVLATISNEANDADQRADSDDPMDL